MYIYILRNEGANRAPVACLRVPRVIFGVLFIPMVLRDEKGTPKQKRGHLANIILDTSYNLFRILQDEW